MFERFTERARQVVVAAQDECRTAGADRIGTEHLLLALLTQPQSLAAAILGRHGVDHARAVTILTRLTHTGAGLDAQGRDAALDPEALRSIGIDLEAVRASVEASFGEGALDAPAETGRRRGFSGHLPFSPRAKKSLELALREAVRLRQRSIGDGHLLLGILREGEGLGAQVLHVAGVDLGVLRQELDDGLREAG